MININGLGRVEILYNTLFINGQNAGDYLWETHRWHPYHCTVCDKELIYYKESGWYYAGEFNRLLALCKICYQKIYILAHIAGEENEGL